MGARSIYLAIFVFLLAGLTFSAAFSENADKVDDLVLQKAAAEESVKVIVTLKEPKEPIFSFRAVDKEELKKDQQEDVISELEDSEVKHEYTIINGFAGELSAEDINKLEADPRVEKISYDIPMHILLNEARPQINASATHLLQINGVNLTGAGQTICIIDTGINYSHADLSGNYLGGYDFVNSDADPYDDHGHGTHVAGIAAANGTIVGIAPGAKIIMIKAMNSGGTGNAADVIAGIDWCVYNRTKYNISVISMSIGEGNYSASSCPTTMDTAINAAYAANISVLAAAGNNASKVGISYPACSPNVTAVSAVDTNDVVGYQRSILTDLLAPGTSIISTWNDGQYYTTSGTSMSTPMVAGAAAILKQFNSSLAPAEVESALQTSGKLIPDIGGTGLVFPRINILEAVLYLNNTAPNITSYYPNASSVNITALGNYTFNITYSDAENDAIVIWYLNNSLVSAAPNYTFIRNVTTAETYNLTVTISDKYLSGGSQYWLLIADNLSTSVNNSAPNITAYSPNSTNASMQQFETKVFSITANDSNGDALSYNWYKNGTLINNATNSSYSFTAAYSDVGNITLLVNVTDPYNASDYHSWNVSVSSRASTGTAPVSASNITGIPAGATPLTLQNVTFSNGTQPILNFNYNFSEKLLDLSNITITKGITSGKGYIFVKGLSLPAGEEKTVYINKVDNEGWVCVKDGEVTAITQVSSSCNTDDQYGDEYKVECDGSPDFGYTCTELTSYYKISGLTHSAVIEYDPPASTSNDDDSSSSSSSAAAGSSTSTATSASNTTTTTTTTPTVTTPTPTKLKTTGEAETDETNESSEEVKVDTAATGFAAKIGEFFSSISDIKWSTWLIIAGILAAGLAGGFFVYKRKRESSGEKLEEEFEESVDEWKDKKKTRPTGISASARNAEEKKKPGIWSRIKRFRFSR